MMLWEFAWAVDGHNRLQGGEEKPPPISDQEFEAELRKHGYG